MWSETLPSVTLPQPVKANNMICVSQIMLLAVRGAFAALQRMSKQFSTVYGKEKREGRGDDMM